MVTTIKKGASSLTIKKLLEKLRGWKDGGINTYDYCGKVKLSKDPIEIQRSLRDEWSSVGIPSK